MPEYPLLPFPTPVIQDRDLGRGFPPTQTRGPSRQRQSQRLDPIFERLANLENSDGLEIVDDPSSLAPERVIVFEVASSIGDFAAACKRVPGLEFLSEQDFELEPDQDFWIVDTHDDRKGQRIDGKLLMGRVYAAMPDMGALSQLLRLWSSYSKHEDAKHGFKRWFKLFDYLYDLRPWGPKDRVTDSTIREFRQQLQDDPHGLVTIEVELWYRRNRNQRDRAWSKLERAVDLASGSIVFRASVPEIAYEAALVKLPRKEILRINDRNLVHLVVCDDIMFVRPQSSPFALPIGEHLASIVSPIGALPDLDLPPVAALLDGVPIQRHQLLDGRVVIDDPDALEDRSIVDKRDHGTAMASLILHGNRSKQERPLNRRLHIHPVMYAPKASQEEIFQSDRLVVDTIYQAILRIKSGTEESEPTAPHVFIINLSLGDRRRPYAGSISPWARLLDYLAYKYGILFIVSAGNILDPLPIPMFRRFSELADAEPLSREKAVLNGLGKQRSNRTLLSPAEALNVITVGAAHSDIEKDGDTSRETGILLDPYGNSSLPNVSSALGLGHCKAIKPDILMPGGREHLLMNSSGAGCNVRTISAGKTFGIWTASPDELGGLGKEGKRGGTSTAAALATRAAHQLFDSLMDPENGAILADADPVYYAVVVRALLVHGASWQEATASKLAKLFGPHGPGKNSARLDNVARLIGYGVPRIEVALSCTPERATLVGYGMIDSGRKAVCRLPLPESLNNVAVPRALIITLAWFSPVNVRSRAYRMVKLEVNGEFKAGLGTPRSKHQPSYFSIPRGTLFHQRYHGQDAVQFIEHGVLEFSITCKVTAGAIDAPIPYGLAVTIEAGDGIPVYQQVRDSLRVRPRS